MKAIISANLLKSADAAPREAPFEIRDPHLKGFILRVQPSGVRSYIAQISRGRRVTLSREGILKPDEARERCKLVLGNVAHGRAPFHGIDGADELTLKQFIDDHYAPWLRAHRPRTAETTLDRIDTLFGKWHSRPLAGITVEMIEDWKTARARGGSKPSTVLRDVMTLSPILSRAVKWGKLKENPCARVDKPRLDRSPKVRYLSPDEATRLRKALQDRDQEKRDARARSNAWRATRKMKPRPDLEQHSDELTPAVLVSLNTGLRRGELLALRWENVDLKGATLTVTAATAKAGQTRHVPLNAEAVQVLEQWRKQHPKAVDVFETTTTLKKSWAALLTRAKVTGFRWHDMRHTFASRLAQAGVPLNTIRELLGHGSLGMTLRYAHLAPDQKREAVAKLGPI